MPSFRGTARSTGIIVGLTIAILIGTAALLAITHSNSASRQQRLVVGQLRNAFADAPGRDRPAG